MALVVDNKRKKDDMDDDGDDSNLENAVVVKKARSDQIIVSDQVQRTSTLLSPNMLLSGHKAEVYSVKFSPDGKHLASGSFDKEIFLWNVQGECENYNVMKGHTGAVIELHWTDAGRQIVSCSTDKTVQLWDSITGIRIKKMREHTAYVNSCCPARRGDPRLVSGSDDSTARIWDSRVRGSIAVLGHNKIPVTSVVFGEPIEGSSSPDQIITGALDNDIRVWDLRRNEVLFTMKGHTDTITGMKISPDGSYLLTNAMDNTVRIWDLRPFAPPQRCVKIFSGVQHNFEKNLLKCAWAPDGSKIAAGSADRFVYVWDTTSRRILYKLPGHTGSVNEVDFHPDEPIIASCSSDRTIFLGEISA
eukprot:TRINITY_DN2026_c0_g1_i1.p1 TRINITY_DN2026_c0_g1~~TRINITY_DN2026_c0_g1_i1.p1  ORF type:complete len:360 (-),score=105.55 TRINITY_DN2026_c0_g1_i1:73-1152(-)